MQEIEPDEDGGDLIVEIAEGIHVRIARKALATVVKPDDEDAEEDEDAARTRASRTTTTSSTARPSSSPTRRSSRHGVEEVNDEGETVNPGAAEDTAPPDAQLAFPPHDPQTP